MHAQAGDRIIVRSQHVGGPVREAEILEVAHPDGSPPYRVRWADSGREALFEPGSDAYVDRGHDGEDDRPGRA